MAGANLAVDFKRRLDENPNTPLLSTPMVKDYILRGATHQMQDHARIVKSDIEVYAGFYLVVGLIVGGSNIMSIVFYW